jgi:hypothetical protein
VTPTRTFSLHGIPITLRGSDEVVALAQARFGRFPPAPADAPPATFEFCGPRDGQGHAVEKPAGTARPFYDLADGEASYYQDAERLYISYYGDGVRALCDLARGHTQLSYLQSDDYSLYLASRLFVTLSLIELLKRRGLYHLHAAGLSLNGQGIVVSGTSGAGKTTLAVALVRAGFDFLSDDMLLLREGAGGLRALGFPDQSDVADETVAMFPELRAALNPAGRRVGWKSQIRVEEFYGVNTVWECRPAVVIFPRIGRQEQSVLTPIDRDEALLELLPNLFLTEAASSQAHLDALTRLAQDAQCYRLETGRDFDALAARLRGLV